ncbi:MAG: hypothetical protein WDM77_19805 [Steroidobacteraceae bacterium]
MTRYLLMPFHAAPLILAAVFSLLGYFAPQAGVLGIPLALILVSWFFKYCFVLLDAVVAGHEELPVLSVEMLNPVDEQRPLIQAVMVCLGFIACWSLYHAVAPLAGLGLGALLLLVLPATIGLLPSATAGSMRSHRWRSDEWSRAWVSPMSRYWPSHWAAPCSSSRWL